jgi:hypothetical protein
VFGPDGVFTTLLLYDHYYLRLDDTVEGRDDLSSGRLIRGTVVILEATDAAARATSAASILEVYSPSLARDATIEGELLFSPNFETTRTS